MGPGEDGYRRSLAALKRGGLLYAYGYSAGVQAQRRMLTMLMWIARLYLWSSGSARTWSGSSGCWQLAPSGRASPSGLLEALHRLQPRI
jgi:NADPH:quinone reductase-like Zn-dependent oxidoreductase